MKCSMAVRKVKTFKKSSITFIIISSNIFLRTSCMTNTCLHGARNRGSILINYKQYCFSYNPLGHISNIPIWDTHQGTCPRELIYMVGITPYHHLEMYACSFKEELCKALASVSCHLCVRDPADLMSKYITSLVRHNFIRSKVCIRVSRIGYFSNKMSKRISARRNLVWWC